ncbi:MAG: iron chelate uptake ABC transporter family permease subunit, partial [Fervidicoccus fontis]
SLISVYEGPIGFIGLIVPHIARMMLGGDISVASLGSLFISPVILLLSDVVARVLLAPSEIPIGIITSLIGAPFFLMLLVKSYRGE